LLHTREKGIEVLFGGKRSNENSNEKWRWRQKLLSVRRFAVREGGKSWLAALQEEADEPAVNGIWRIVLWIVKGGGQ